MDKQQLLLEALRAGAGQADEIRLYRSGKLPGLFPTRASQHAEAAAEAIRDGLIEIVHTETKGKVVVEWARVTPKGLDHLVRHESPTRALDELRAALRLNAEGLPQWVAELRQRIDALSREFLGEVENVSRRLDQVAQRVADAIDRLERAHGAADHLPPWTREALDYLDSRRRVVPDRPCTLAELFNALRSRGTDLGLKDYHLGLRRLHESGRLRLLTQAGDDVPDEPEYALLDGATVYYYAAPASEGE